jgi:hypothetical protein
VEKWTNQFVVFFHQTEEITIHAFPPTVVPGGDPRSFFLGEKPTAYSEILCGVK